MTLAVALALGHRGANLRHLAGIIAGVTAGVVLLVCAVAVANALQSQALTKLARDGVLDDLGHEDEGDPPRDHAGLLRSVLLVDGPSGMVTVTRLADHGAAGPVVGVDPLPDAGAVLVSPALRDVLETEEGRVLRGWLPSTPTGVLPDGALVRPSELVAVAVLTPQQLRAAGPVEVVPPVAPSGSAGTARRVC